MALAVLEGLPAPRSIRMTWRAVRGEISSDGTHAYTSGYGRRLTAGGADSTYMRYIAYWRLNGGRWRVAALVIAPGAVNGTAAPAGCESPATTFNANTRADVNAVRSALIATDSSFSARSARDGAAAAFSEYIADDGANLGGAAEMICGRAAIASEMRDVAPGALVWTPRLADAAPSGDLGFTVGVATVTHGSERHTSKYLTVWKKQRDGSWRFIADGGNSAPAP
jgi:ketosteroid isomerase-like protein